MILRLQYRSFGSTARSSSKAKFFAGFFEYHVGVFDGKTLKTYVLSRISILSLTFLDQLITRRSGVAQNKTIEYRFIQALSPKQGAHRREPATDEGRLCDGTGLCSHKQKRHGVAFFTSAVPKSKNYATGLGYVRTFLDTPR